MQIAPVFLSFYNTIISDCTSIVYEIILSHCKRNPGLLE